MLRMRPLKGWRLELQEAALVALTPGAGQEQTQILPDNFLFPPFFFFQKKFQDTIFVFIS